MGDGGVGVGRSVFNKPTLQLRNVGGGGVGCARDMRDHRERRYSGSRGCNFTT